MWTSLRIYIYKIVDFISGLSGLLYRTGWTSVNGILTSSKNDLDCLHETKIKQIFEKYKVKYDYSFDEEQKLVSLIMLF